MINFDCFLLFFTIRLRQDFKHFTKKLQKNNRGHFYLTSFEDLIKKSNKQNSQKQQTLLIHGPGDSRFY